MSKFARILVEFLVGDVPTFLTLVKEFVQKSKGGSLVGFNRPTIEHEGVDGLGTHWRALQATVPVLNKV